MLFSNAFSWKNIFILIQICWNWWFKNYSSNWVKTSIWPCILRFYMTATKTGPVTWPCYYPSHAMLLLSHPGIPGVTLCIVPVRTPPPPPPPPPPPAADSCPRDNFWTTFGISFIFGTIVGPDLQINWLDFGRISSWPWPWIFKVKYRIGYISAKNDPIATKRKANTATEL